jgi:molybdopterin molybdotransferase
VSEPDVSNLLSVAQAIQILDAAAVSPRVIRVPLDQAHGLRLAQDILADRDYPPFDKSLMDGFAVRSADVTSAPVRLPVAGEIPAGAAPPRALRAGEAMAIMTGAPLPSGANAVVPVEDTERRGTEVQITRAAAAGRFIAARGADCRAGATVLTRGNQLEAAQLAVAASVGAAQVDVFAQPRAAVLSTGNEIVPIDRTPGTAQIRNSNSLMLISLLRRLGCDVTDRGVVSDDFETIRNAIRSAMEEIDALFITGGMSMGEYDFVPRALQSLGVDLRITKLRIKPGKPFVFGVVPKAAEQGGERFVFGLPGNPVSSFACTLRLCARLLDRMSGGEPRERWLAGKLESALPANGPREFYQPAVYDYRDGQAGLVRPLSWKGSADIFTLAAANVLLVRGENQPPLPAGAAVRVLQLPD